MSKVSTALLAVGYPTSMAVITRLVSVMKRRRVRWFVAHQAAVTAIIAGWAMKGRIGGVVVNGAWMAFTTAWWVRSGRTRAA